MPLADLGAKSAPGACENRDRLLLQLLIIGHDPQIRDPHGTVSGADLDIINLLRNQIIRQKVLDIVIREYGLLHLLLVRGPALLLCDISRRHSLPFSVNHGKLQRRLNILLSLKFHHKIGACLYLLPDLPDLFNISPLPGSQRNILRIVKSLLIRHILIGRPVR